MMRHRGRRLEIAGVVCAITAWATGPALASDSTCYGEWSDAAPIVAREQLRAVREVQELARSHVPGDLIRITLCREDERFVYRVLIRDLHGRISNLKLDARLPFPR